VTVSTITVASRLSAAVGDRTAKKFREAFGFETVGDLLQHYPRAYVPRGETSDLATLQPGEYTTVVGQVVSSTLHPYRDRRTGRTAFRLEVVVVVGDGRLSLTFFDRKKHVAEWRHGRLGAGTFGMFEGRADWDRYKHRWQLVHPQTDVLADDGGASGRERVEEERRRLTGLRPVYPAAKKVSSWVLESSVRLVLDLLAEVPDPVPATVREQRELLPALQALTLIHRPDSWQEKQAAERTLRFAEAFVAQTVLARRRAALATQPAAPRHGTDGGLLDRFDERLPFRLTAGQESVGKQILDDLAAGHPMHRLLQGEVGSGKTVVALRAMLRVVDAGGQAALLAPTEVLAQQHHRSITAMLGDLAAGGMLGGAEGGTQVALLTGSLSAAARREALLDVASGAAGIVVGTHALLEEHVSFADLGLVVVDEQHRFGVEQRAALAAKAGETPPHVLVMTATPIPRTVAMTVFGDLETSTLTELPAGRAAIQSSVVPLRLQPQWLDRAWQRVREEVEKGRQVYVVCPRIGGDQPDDNSGPDLSAPIPGTGDAASEERRPAAAVDEVAPMLAAGPLAGLRVESLHGRLAPDRKESVMRSFAAGEVDVLVSTTVIEVGVDVGNASVMLILDADRFGVSQLHQLRGRVGRGGHPGLCLLVSDADAGSPALDRLEAVAATTDGFELSRVDLEQRREGDVLGAAQSGRRSGLRLLSVLAHEEVIVDARSAAAEVVAQDPDLADHPDLADAVRLLDESHQSEYMEKA
jgi:ATP-dependent DNA helicase RecG